MKMQKSEEIKEYLAELSAIVDLYNPLKEYFNIQGAVVAAIIIIGLTVISTVGILWGIMLCGLALVPFCYVDLPVSHPTENELAKRACILMSSCIERYKYPEREIYFIDYNYNGNNLSLYREFISLFPQMASKKLKKLSSIKIR